MTQAVDSNLQSDIEQYRIELTGYCYRMLGSSFEADDAVQDTMVRAWKSIDSFEGRSSLRSWLYRIATNVCLTMIESRGRRALPMDMGPKSNADTPIGPKRYEVPWIEPIADAQAIPTNVDPAEAIVLKESLRLAFITALQSLPARQRAALILCEVLRWSAEEVAVFLETTVASVNSALQRARATLAGQRDEVDLRDPLAEETADKYAAAFERYDMVALAALLRDDVIMSMPPYDLWLQGPDQVAAWMTGQGHSCEGSRVIPVEVNGSHGFGQYRVDRNGGYAAWALGVLDIEDGKVSGITSFLEVENWFPRFGLPLHLDA